jgi:hypothetical protein
VAELGEAVKVATFTVRATVAQSERWKRAAEAEGFASAGGWLAEAADTYLRVRLRAGRPLPLAWRRGRFPVVLEGGETVTLPGFMSPPFAAFRGTAEGPGYQACHRHTLVHLPERRIIATLRTYRQCQVLASELAPALLRQELPEPERIVERHRREST